MGGVQYIAMVFEWVVCVKWGQHECQDPHFLAEHCIVRR